MEPDATTPDSTHTLGEALTTATATLRRSGATPTPELDAQVLLSCTTGLPRATLLAFPERALAPHAAHTFASLIARRAEGEPVSYLTGSREFYGLTFHTDRRGLIPRPETELLVEAALNDIRGRLAEHPATPPVVADIGTGSGAIAVTIAVTIAARAPDVPHLYATDISADALALALRNAQLHGVADRITFMRGDLLGPLSEPVDVLVANLPYVARRNEATLPVDVRRYEPELALYGEDEGLGHFRRLFAQAPSHLKPDASLYLEFGYDQRTAIEALARQTFPDARITVIADYAGWDRLIAIRTIGHDSPRKA